MKNKIISLAVLAIVASTLVGRAEVSVTFACNAGTLTDHNGAALSANRLFLVYWSLDNSVSGFNSADPLSPLGGDVLLNNPQTGTAGYDTSAGPDIAGRITNPASAYVWNAGSSGLGNGFMYIAIFETAYVASPASIGAGTYYGLGTTLDLTERNGITPAPSPDDYGALINSSPIQTSLQVVPEPSSMALLGVGLALVAWRRMARK